MGNSVPEPEPEPKRANSLSLQSRALLFMHEVFICRPQIPIRPPSRPSWVDVVLVI